MGSSRVHFGIFGMIFGLLVGGFSQLTAVCLLQLAFFNLTAGSNLAGSTKNGVFCDEKCA
jgi:hypothetical protein